MSKTINTTITTPLDLTSADNPLTITSSGTVYSTSGGASLDGAANVAWNITNDGLVGQSGGEQILFDDGIVLTSDKTSTILNNGTIQGALAVEIVGKGTITNYGLISGDIPVRSGGQPIEITGGGTVVNYGTITTNGGYPISISGGKGTIINDGSISAVIDLSDGGTVTNSDTIFTPGYLDSGTAVVISGSTGSVSNSGLLDGGFAGVSLESGGTVTNSGVIGILNYGPGSEQFGVSISGAAGSVSNSGDISGGGEGVTLANGGTVTNSGTIFGEIDSVLFKSTTSNNLLVIDPGAVFNGTVQGSGSLSTVELAKGSGTISGVGTGQFQGFNTLEVASGGAWTLSGSNTIGTISNDGTMTISGSLDSAIDPSSKGLFSLTSGSTFEVTTAIGISSKISFMPSSELIIDDLFGFGQNIGTSNYNGPLLEAFGSGATIDLKDISASGISDTYHSGLLQLTNGSEKATLSFQNSSLGSGTFHFANDGGSGVLITRS